MKYCAVSGESSIFGIAGWEKEKESERVETRRGADEAGAGDERGDGGGGEEKATDGGGEEGRGI